MRMEFIFSRKILKQKGLTINNVLAPIRAFLAERCADISEPEIGLFFGGEQDFAAFSELARRLCGRDWFVSAIKSWIWQVDNHTACECLEGIDSSAVDLQVFSGEILPRNKRCAAELGAVIEKLSAFKALAEQNGNVDFMDLQSAVNMLAAVHPTKKRDFKAKMEFAFDEEKLKKYNLTPERAFAIIGKFFSRRASSINEVAPGVFYGYNNHDTECFLAAPWLFDFEWFADCVTEAWFTDDDAVRAESLIKAHNEAK